MIQRNRSYILIVLIILGCFGVGFGLGYGIGYWCKYRKANVTEDTVIKVYRDYSYGEFMDTLQNKGVIKSWKWFEKSADIGRSSGFYNRNSRQNFALYKVFLALRGRWQRSSAGTEFRASGGGNDHCRRNTGDSHGLTCLTALLQFLLQIAHLGLALGAGAGAFSLEFALGSDEFNVIFRRNLPADLFQDLTLAFSAHNIPPFLIYTV